MIVTWLDKTMDVAREDLALQETEVYKSHVEFTGKGAIFTDCKTGEVLIIPNEWLVSIFEDWD